MTEDIKLLVQKSWAKSWHSGAKSRAAHRLVDALCVHIHKIRSAKSVEESMKHYFLINQILDTLRKHYWKWDGVK